MMAAVAVDLAPGRRVGPYRLLFQLGKGGMGEVWAAQRASKFDFEKIVALKVLIGADPGSNSMVMFFDEARAAASMQHAAIVPTLDLDKDGDTFFIAMEMVRGPSLTGLLQRLAPKKKPMSPVMVAYIGERISSALDYAHTRAAINGKKLELIHRDVSPHNILLDSTGSVRLMDFGVARTAVQDHESRVGTVRGKPSYMSPEQVRSEDLDARSDVFSLGTVLYESACLRRLFGRGKPLKSMEAVLEHEPTPLTKRVERFPVPLWEVIQRALQKDKDARWADAGELNRALTEMLYLLPGSSSVSRDLGALVDDVFGADAFDVDARIRESSALIRTPPEPASEAVPEVPDAAADAAFSEALATNIVWPSAVGADPFAQDAIAAAQSQIAGTPSSIPAMAFDTTGSSPAAAIAKPKSSNAAALLAVLAALVLGVGAMLVFTRKQADPIEIQLTPAVSPGAVGSADRIGAIGGTPAAPEPARATAPPEPPKPRAAGPVKPSKQRAPAPVVTEPEVQEPPPPPVVAPATRTEVWGLIQRLESLDPGAASAMKATLAEAGGDTRKLNMLRTQAKAALGSHTAPN